MSFVTFLKQNLAYIKLGVSSKLQYRTNFIAGIVILPLVSFGIESLFWLGIFKTSGQATIGGFSSMQYVTYLLWLMLQIGTANLHLERTMIMEINNGSVNAFLLRPTSFFQYHFGQLIGYKLVAVISMVPVMLLLAWWWQLPFHVDRLLPALALGLYYLVMIHILNFAVFSTAFFFDHVYSLTVTKNMINWFLVGEILPLDLLPSPFREWVIALPFSCGVYLPAAYVSGRITTEAFMKGFISLAIGGVVFGLLARFIWMRGLRRYGGTGA